MVRGKPYKVPEYGGLPQIAGFWGSEIVCDLFTLLGLLTVVGQCLGTALLYTRYGAVADNRLMRLMQDRFIICGWDGLLAADMLGLADAAASSVPTNSTNGTTSVTTKCSLGALLQLVYLSGPSGLVHLGGDYIFHDGGFSKDPVRFRYTVAQAMAMGLFDTGHGSAMSKYVVPTTHNGNNTTGDNNSHAPPTDRPSVGSTTRGGHGNGEDTPPPAAAATSVATTKTSIYTRRLRLVAEGDQLARV